MVVKELLGECKSKYRDGSIEGIDDARPETGHESGLMSAAQRALDHKYGDGTDGGGCTHTHHESFKHVDYHMTCVQIATALRASQ